MVILAINFNHDGSVIVLVDGALGAFVTTERHSRKKKHPGARPADVARALASAGVDVSDVDLVLLCNLNNMDSPDVPAAHGTNLKETWPEFWVNQTGERVRLFDREMPCIVNPDHSLSHASSAFFTAPFASGVSVAIDPTGCRAYLGQDATIVPVARDFDRWFNANVAYCYVANHLFGSAVTGAGKVMGLAPYGRPERYEPERWAGCTTFAELLAVAEEQPVIVEVDGRPVNALLAFIVQDALESQLCRLFDELEELCGRNGVAANVCLSGGTALNAVANQIAFTRSGFEALHFHPACGDDGTPLGAALWHWHTVLGHPRRTYTPAELMYSTTTYTDADVAAALAGHRGALDVHRSADAIGDAARLLADGAVVGWCDGPGEIGPRALGHRSILADPRSAAMRDHINGRVKFREAFRPLAPSVRREDAATWFDVGDSPFMLLAARVKRPGVAAVTHVDGTARVQTVARADNPRYHELLTRFAELTGVPLLLNTSLNTKSEPIAEAPTDVVDVLLRCELDALVMGDHVVRRRAPAVPPVGAGASVGAVP